MNATYLFEKPYRKFHNSEPWWSAYFTILALWMSSKDTPLSVPVYEARGNGLLDAVDVIDFSGANYANLIADARLHGELFDIENWPNEFLHLRPDITFFRSLEKKKIVFVETKTIGASVQGNIANYPRISRFLEDCGWCVELIFLLSKGHEQISDWELLANHSARIITWEDVFDKAIGTPFEEILGGNLNNYIS